MSSIASEAPTHSTLWEARIPSGIARHDVEFSPGVRLPIEELLIISGMQTAYGIGRLLNVSYKPRVLSVHSTQEGGQSLVVQGEHTVVTFSSTGTIEHDQIAGLFYSYTGTSLTFINYVREIHCDCPSDGCDNLGLRGVRYFDLDYTALTNRLIHRYPEFFESSEKSTGRLVDIVNAINSIDPEGLSEFDVRLNKQSATHFGCVEVLEHQVRESPYGAEHMPAEELKTLCYLVTPKVEPPFIIMLNTMASERVSNAAVKEVIRSSQWGQKLDIVPADIEALFGIEKGEVHPLSLLPQKGSETTLPVVHIYDEQLYNNRRYVTTNGGHPDWTTEFRSDFFVKVMEHRFNREGDQPLVLIAPIGKRDDDALVAEPNLPSVWEHTKETLLGDPQVVRSLDRPRHAFFLTCDATDSFVNSVRDALIRSSDEDCDEAPVVLNVLRQPKLDFEVVKFPQCWRPLLKELSQAITQMVRENANVLFVDCNITPLEQIFSDRLPAPARTFMIERLRSDLGEMMTDIPDDKLLHHIASRIELLSKPVVIMEYVRELTRTNRFVDLFVVGGSQVSDPALSKYHDGWMSIGKQVEVNVLNSEQVIAAKRAMYYIEAEGQEGGQKQALELYQIIDSMWPKITDPDVERPIIVLASTSLCQAYQDNGNEVIPESSIEYLASEMQVSPDVIRSRREALKNVTIVNTSEIYARASASLLSFKREYYGEVFT